MALVIRTVLGFFSPGRWTVAGCILVWLVYYYPVVLLAETYNASYAAILACCHLLEFLVVGGVVCSEGIYFHQHSVNSPLDCRIGGKRIDVI